MSGIWCEVINSWVEKTSIRMFILLNCVSVSCIVSIAWSKKSSMTKFVLFAISKVTLFLLDRSHMTFFV